MKSGKVRLTQAVAEAASLPEGKDDHFIYDDKNPDYAVRIRRQRSGQIAKAWAKGYRFAGQYRRITIGDIDIVREPQARKRADEIEAMVRLGRDPKAEAAEAKTEAADTFGRVLRPYLAQKEKEVRASTFTEVRYNLEVQFKSFHRLPLKRIDQRLAAARIAEITIDSGPSAAKVARSHGSAFLTHLMRSGIAASNPFANTPVPKTNEEERRPLNDDELRGINAALLPDDDFSQVVTVLMFTGQRRSEIGNLEWSEVNLDKAAITLPPHKTKNEEWHTFPLSQPVRAIIERQPRTFADGTLRRFVFGRLQNSGFTSFGRGKAALDKRIAEMRGAPLEHWTLHILRHTFSTRCHDDLDVSPHIVEACIGHTGGHRAGVAGRYNHAAYARQMAAAMTDWARHLTAILENRDAEGNVVALKTAL
jgi:integrase